jgi:nitrogen fixation/metabolism regulation signal transduction histidine kinase
MTKAARWGWLVAGLAVLGVSLVGAFLVSFSSAQAGLREREFAWLFWINAAVALLLALVLGVVGLRLFLRLRQGRFGSRLLLKLAATFALVGVLPGAVIYTVSWQFAVRSLESWFDERMAQALDAGLSLGRGMLESMQSDLAGKAQLAAGRLAETGGLGSPLALERLREQLGAAEVSLVGPVGQVLFTAGGAGVSGWAAQRPSATLLREARAGRVGSQIDGLEDPSGDAQLRVLVPVPSTEISLRSPQERYLLVVQPLQRSLAANALAVQSAYSEYQQRALARDALRRMVIGTLTLAGVLAVFGAVLGAGAYAAEVAEVARECGCVDLDNTQPPSIRSLQFLVSVCVCM